MTDDDLNRMIEAIERGLDQERKIQMPIDLAGKRYYVNFANAVSWRFKLSGSDVILHKCKEA